MKKTIIMGDEYITNKQAMNIFEKKTDVEKITILKKALLKKCEGKKHFDYMILLQLDEVAYSDMWGDDKNGFLYKKLK